MLGTMPKKKQPAGKKKYSRSRDAGDVVYIGAEVEPEIAKAINEYCEANGIKKRFLIESALRIHLKSMGLLGNPELK